MSVVRRKDSGGSGGRGAGISTSLPDRQPPYNLDAERAVLCSMLLRAEVCDDLTPILLDTDFYDDAHRRLYQHMSRMYESGRRIDLTLLVEELKREGDLERVGGVAFLGNLSTAVATAAHAEYYARILRQHGICRTLIHECTDILRGAYEYQDDAQHLVNRAEEQIFSIQEHRQQSTVKEIGDVLHEAMDRIDARMKGEHVADGVETGFTEFDNLTGGLHNSELIILAARPSMGKTALAMNIAEHVILKLARPVLFVSLEMSAMELVDRMLCSVAEVNGARLRTGTLSKEDRKRLVEKAAEINEAPLYIDDSPSRSVGQVAAAARRLKRVFREKKIELGLIVIDYLQLIEPDNTSDPRQEQVAQHGASTKRAGTRTRHTSALPGAAESAGGSRQGEPPAAEPSPRIGRH